VRVGDAWYYFHNACSKRKVLEWGRLDELGPSAGPVLKVMVDCWAEGLRVNRHADDAPLLAPLEHEVDRREEWLDQPRMEQAVGMLRALPRPDVHREFDLKYLEMSLAACLAQGRREVIYTKRKKGRRYALARPVQYTDGGGGGGSRVRFLSMSGCPRRLRLLCQGARCRDYDLWCAVPSIALQKLEVLARENAGLLDPEADLAALRLYAGSKESREARLAAMLAVWPEKTRDDAKEHVNKVMNGGAPWASPAFPSWADTGVRPGVVARLARDMRRVRNAILTGTEIGRTLLALPRKHNADDDSHRRTAWSYLTCEWEDEVMCHVVPAIEARGARVDALIYDGCHAADGGNSPIDLRAVEADVLGACGLRIRLEEKPLFGLQDEYLIELASLLS